MRAFLTCACLTVAVLGLGATSARADHWYRHGRVYVGHPAPVIVRAAPVIVTAPAPVIFAQPAPVVIAQPTVIAPSYVPAPVIVTPAFRPVLSFRLGIGR